MDTDRLAATGKILAPRFFPPHYTGEVRSRRRYWWGEGGSRKRFSRGGARKSSPVIGITERRA